MTMKSRKRAASDEKRENQQNIRYNDSELKKILRAAGIVGATPSKFQAEAALKEAEKVLKRQGIDL